MNKGWKGLSEELKQAIEWHLAREQLGGSAEEFHKRELAILTGARDHIGYLEAVIEAFINASGRSK